MSVNTIPVSARNAPWQAITTANGSYTLPQYAYIPHPDLQQLARGTVLAPSFMGASQAVFALVPNIAQRAYPTPSTPGAFAIRQASFKAGPSAT